MTRLVLHRYDAIADADVAYVGLPLSAGPLPTLFYFSLSAHDSLLLDPFNQPVTFLSSFPSRIFSMTLPGHEHGLPPTDALNIWAAEIAQGRNVIGQFVESVGRVVRSLQREGALLPNQLGVAGLSRGAFIGTHVAHAMAEFRSVLGFAPLTKLSYAKEFHGLSHSKMLCSLDLETLVDQLTDRHVRFYIGNLDTRVSTRSCFEFIEKLSQAALHKKIRSPKAELIISPSIGRDGHGTSPPIFHDGAKWMAHQLGLCDEL